MRARSHQEYDVVNLQAMFSGLGLISELLNSILKVAEKMAGARFSSPDKE